MNIEKDCIFITNHHRKSWFFEDTVRRTLGLGARWVIQNTTWPNGFGELAEDIRYNKAVRFVDIGNSSYDAGMVRFKTASLVPDCKYVVLMDNDLFLSGTDELVKYLSEVEDGNYDLVCHTVGADHNAGKYQDRLIAELTDLAFSEPGAGNMPADIRTPNPHFENAFLVYSKKLWDKFTAHDLSHHRRLMMAAAREKAKIGTHKAEYEWGYTQWGSDWHHTGNLFTYYYWVESGDVSRFKPDSQFDRFRLGYFAAQEREYGRVYQPSIEKNLASLYAHMGGKESVLACWDELHAKHKFAWRKA